MKSYQINLKQTIYIKCLFTYFFNFQDSRAPQDNDLCYESCEPMMLKKEYASF